MIDNQKIVIEIGANIRPQAHLIPGWENERVYLLDADPAQKPDILADAGLLPEGLPEGFAGHVDMLFASHVLEHFSFWKTEEVLRRWLDCLEEGGELHIVVPSAEWAAREILSDNPSPATLPHLYAGQVNQWDLHYTTFTMRGLRAYAERAGGSVVLARSGPYGLHVNGQIHQAEQHYIKTIKGQPRLEKS